MVTRTFPELEIGIQLRLFYRHVFEFTGFEDFAALEALDEFGVFLTGNDLHARVFTRCHGWFFRETELKLEVIIRIATSDPSGQDFAGIGVFLALREQLSSTEISFSWRGVVPYRHRLRSGNPECCN